MTFNVTGMEVANGVSDPTTMFLIVGTVLGVALIALIVIWILNMIK